MAFDGTRESCPNYNSTTRELEMIMLILQEV